MRLLIPVVLSLTLLHTPTALSIPGRGALVLVGGGGTPAAVLARAVELAGGPGARIAVLPQASEAPDRGSGFEELWKPAGAGEVTVVEDLQAPETRAALVAANLIWLPGGDQVALLEALKAADLCELIRERHDAGVVVGGTSAGAAAVGAVMISGKPEPGPYRRGGMHPHEGLSLWPQVIVDQHCAERQREGRLLTVVLDHPRLLGVGIGERTAVILDGDAFEVLGEGSVLVVDARSAEISEAEAGALRSARGTRIDVLRAGEHHSY
jgi:cyanophycinase